MRTHGFRQTQRTYEYILCLSCVRASHHILAIYLFTIRRFGLPGATRRPHPLPGSPSRTRSLRHPPRHMPPLPPPPPLQKGASSPCLLLLLLVLTVFLVEQTTNAFVSPSPSSAVSLQSRRQGALPPLGPSTLSSPPAIQTLPTLHHFDLNRREDTEVSLYCCFFTGLKNYTCCHSMSMGACSPSLSTQSSLPPSLSPPKKQKNLPVVVLHGPLGSSRNFRGWTNISLVLLAHPSFPPSLSPPKKQKNLPVVVLHGLLGSSRNFRGWASALHERLEKPRRILVPDLRNHGQSPHVGGMSYR